MYVLHMAFGDSQGQVWKSWLIESSKACAKSYHLRLEVLTNKLKLHVSFVMDAQRSLDCSGARLYKGTRERANIAAVLHNLP